MHINTIALTIISLCAPMLFASQNTTQDFMLRTELKSKQSSASVRQRFDNLWLTLHPTGAGFYDAILTQHESSAFGLNASLADIVHTDYYSNLAFDPVNNFYFHNEGLGNDVHYVLDMKINTDFGAAWEPVGITVASVKPKLGGFWMNTTGLQWTTAPAHADSTFFHQNRFGGWLVCDWFHNAPQLFFRISNMNWVAAPDTCAEVNLVPKYI